MDFLSDIVFVADISEDRVPGPSPGTGESRRITMKTILMTMTALAALSVAAPAMAQPWNGRQNQTADLQTRLDSGIRSGEISRREAMPLQESLRQLLSLERQYSANGFTGRENAALR